jgi:hypothetical protein
LWRRTFRDTKWVKEICLHSRGCGINGRILMGKSSRVVRSSQRHPIHS